MKRSIEEVEGPRVDSAARAEWQLIITPVSSKRKISDSGARLGSAGAASTAPGSSCSKDSRLSLALLGLQSIIGRAHVSNVISSRPAGPRPDGELTQAALPSQNSSAAVAAAACESEPGETHSASRAKEWERSEEPRFD